jgi:hypothetical protein
MMKSRRSPHTWHLKVFAAQPHPPLRRGCLHQVCLPLTRGHTRRFASDRGEFSPNGVEYSDAAQSTAMMCQQNLSVGGPWADAAPHHRTTAVCELGRPSVISRHSPAGPCRNSRRAGLDLMPTVKELQTAGCEALRAIAAGLEERGGG